jgi:putative flippase GtrA
MNFLLGLLKKYKIIRFGISGSLGVLVHLVFLYIFVNYFNIWYLLATCLAFCISATTGYLMQKFFTFKNDSKNIKTQFATYFVFNIGTFVLNILMMYLFVDYLNIIYLVAQVLACFLNAIISYLVFNKFIFK